MVKRLIVFFCCISFVCSLAHAQALPVSLMQRVVSKLINNQSIKRGFAANDPRFIQTLNRTSGITADLAGTVAATVVTGAVTAPAWATVALGLGVGITVSLAVGGLISWVFPSVSEKANVLVKNTDTQPSNPPVVQGGPYWITGTLSVSASTAMAAIQTVLPLNWPGDALTYWEIGVCTDATNPIKTTCLLTRVTRATGYKQIGAAGVSASYYASGAPGSCGAGYAHKSGSCIAVPQTVQADATLPIPDAVTQLTPQELAKPANPQIVATLADQLWRRAASLPGYDGLPYVAADPITQTDAETLRQSDPVNWPSVQDLVSAQPSTNQPWKLPVNPASVSQDSATVSPGVNPAEGQPQSNLGTDPGIGSPNLEATPTAQQILQPLLDLLPSFRSFVVPSHQAACPKPTFNVFGKQIVMDAHCTIAEEQRAALFAVMAAVWALSAAFIILRA